MHSFIRMASESLGVLFEFKSMEISDSGSRMDICMLSTFLRTEEVMVVAIRDVFVP